MYGKIFESMYDGTLATDWKAMIVFQQFIVLADREGIVDYTPEALNRRTGIPLDIIEHGIKKLQEPDPFSRSPEFKGCRIALLEDHRPWGWMIVNYAHYCQLASSEDRARQSTERSRKWRETHKSDDATQGTDGDAEGRSGTPGDAKGRKGRHIDGDGDGDGDIDKSLLSTSGAPQKDESKSAIKKKASKRVPADFEVSDKLMAFGIDHGLTETEILQAAEAFKDHEFKDARKDWPATFRNWLRREIKWRSKHPGAKLTYAEKLAQDIEQLEQNEQQKLIGHVADE